MPTRYAPSGWAYGSAIQLPAGVAAMTVVPSGIADIGAAGDVFGIRAVGDEVGNDGALGGRGGRFEDAGDDVLFVGRELQSAAGLSRLQGKGLAWVLYALLLLLFALCHALADHL